MKLIQILIAALIVALVGTSIVNAGTTPYPLSTAPYAYDSVFPSYQLNADFTYALGYTDSSTAAITPQSWQVITASQVAAAGNYLAVNTTVSAITVTLPAAPTGSSPLLSIRMLDAANTFATHNLTISASGIAPINSLSGASAVVTGATNGEELVCTYLNGTIGYNCNVR